MTLRAKLKPDPVAPPQLRRPAPQSGGRDRTAQCQLRRSMNSIRPLSAWSISQTQFSTR